MLLPPLLLVTTTTTASTTYTTTTTPLPLGLVAVGRAGLPPALVVFSCQVNDAVCGSDAKVGQGVLWLDVGGREDALAPGSLGEQGRGQACIRTAVHRRRRGGTPPWTPLPPPSPPSNV